MKLRVQEMLVARLFTPSKFQKHNQPRCPAVWRIKALRCVGGILAAWLGYVLDCKGKSDPLLIVLNRSYEYRGGFLGRCFFVAEVFGDALWAFFQRVTKYCVILASQFEYSLVWTNTFKAHSVGFFCQVTPVYQLPYTGKGLENEQTDT